MREPLVFVKMTGAGNDFIVFDNRDGRIPEGRGTFIRRLCERRLGVGADGALLVEPSATQDFRMRYYNADGGEAEMCGNGGRCISRFAYLKGIAGKRMSFETVAGIYHSEVVGENVRLEMVDPKDIQVRSEIEVSGRRFPIHFANTGVPHGVVFVEDVEAVDVVNVGRTLRWHERFAPAGTNANFVQILGPSRMKIRTYERGVEDETLACGTGTVASAVLGGLLGILVPPVEAETRSGLILMVHFDLGDQMVKNVFLEGDARIVFEGTLLEEWTRLLTGSSSVWMR